MKKIWSVVLIALCMCAGSGIQAQQASAIKTLTSKEYYTKMQKDTKVRVLMFGQSGCKPCNEAKQTILPVLVSKYANNENVEVYFVDVSKDSLYNGKSLYEEACPCNSVPVFVVFYNNTTMFYSCGYDKKYQAALEKRIDQIVNEILY